MRSIWKYAILNALCLLLSITAANAQITPPTPPSTPPATETATIVSKDLKVEFPEIEGWERSEITEYPTPELGYSINYDSPEAGRVTVYVYNLGMNDISNDVNHNTIKTEIERSKGEIVKIGEMGYYQDVKELKKDVVTLGGETGKIKAQHALFNYSMRGNSLASEIYLLGHKKHFIKIRATYPKVEGESDNKALADFLVELEKILSN